MWIESEREGVGSRMRVVITCLSVSVKLAKKVERGVDLFALIYSFRWQLKRTKIKQKTIWLHFKQNKITQTLICMSVCRRNFYLLFCFSFSISFFFLCFSLSRAFKSNWQPGDWLCSSHKCIAERKRRFPLNGWQGVRGS